MSDQQQSTCEHSLQDAGKSENVGSPDQPVALTQAFHELSRVVPGGQSSGQAVGLLIAGAARDMETASAMIVCTSQQANVKIHEVALLLAAEVASSHSGSLTDSRGLGGESR